MRLLKLKLKNFKGIRDFEMAMPEGQTSMSVYGDNATGKTTLFDGFSWLLFGKDSQNRTNFEIKTLGEDGKPIANIDHSVYAEFETDNGQLTLERVYRERYQSKRGYEEVLAGHTTDYLINGVPVKEREYKDYIDKLIPENIFKLITNPLFFNEQLKWEDRRRILMEICGEVSDEDIINRNKNLKPLLDMLTGKTVDDLKKIIASKRKAIKDELDMIPARIDELVRTLSKTNIDYAAESQRREKFAAELAVLQEQKARLRSGGALGETQSQLILVEAKLKARKEDVESEWRRSDDIYHAKKRELSDELARNNRLMDELKSQINLQGQLMEEAHDREVAVNKEWENLNGRTFNFTNETICPTCHQSLPEDQVAAARTKALEDYNLKKSKELTELKNRIQQQTFQYEQHRTNKEKSEKALAELVTVIGSIENDIAKLEGEHLFTVKPDVNSDAEYMQLLTQQSELREKLANLDATIVDEEAALSRKISELNQEIAVAINNMATSESANQAKARVKELEERQLELRRDFDVVLDQQVLVEEFMMAKVEALESVVADKFKLARFKLFEQQVNGGIKECCETLYRDVPYSSMNNAARINVGLDIINTLTAHYKLSAPVFIDNAEAVTQFIDCDSQVIRLVVSSNHRKLTVN